MAKARPPQSVQPRRRGVGSLLLTAAPWVGMAALAALWSQARRKPKPGLSEQTVAAPEHFEQAEPGRGRLARHPHRIPPRGWKDVLWRTWREIGRDRLPGVAGGVTFAMLLAIFPGVAVFVSLYGLVADVTLVSKQMDQLAAFVPHQVLSLLGEQMMRLATERPASLSVAFVVSLVFALWTANAAMGALINGLNIAYDEEERRPLLARSGVSWGLTLGTLIFVVAVTAILVALPVALDWLRLTPYLGWLLPLRWVLLLVVAGCAFAVLYRYGPSRALARWRWVRWGAAAAAILWLAGSAGFSWYINNVAHYDVTYGSLGAAIGFMMWVWFSVMAVLLGAELNAEIEHQTALDSTTGPPEPMGARGAAMADTVGLAFKPNLAARISAMWRGRRGAAR